jgi:hypothetical protein
MEIDFLIGDTEYPVAESDARWLAQAVRRTCLDAAGQPWDREARAALQVADSVEESLGRRAPDTIELEHVAALGLLGYAFHDRDSPDVYAHVAASYGVAALYLALRRLALDALERRRGG